MCSIDRYYMKWNRIFLLENRSGFFPLPSGSDTSLGKELEGRASLEEAESDEETIYISEDQQSLFHLRMRQCLPRCSELWGKRRIEVF